MSIGMLSKKRPQFAYSLLLVFPATSQTNPMRGAQLSVSLNAGFTVGADLTSWPSQRIPPLIVRADPTRQLSCTYHAVFRESGSETSGTANCQVVGSLLT